MARRRRCEGVLDMTPTILSLTPTLMPIVKQAGIESVYFGVLSSSTARSA
jgi:TRAP-type C4-dicarboxylate transport system permease large subunit